jgi:hypothetical protein
MAEKARGKGNMQLVKSSMHEVQHDPFSQVKGHAGAETKRSAYNHVEIRKRGGSRKRQQKLSEKLKRVPFPRP